jgi:arsenate reductase (thioredoxin)
VIKVLFACVHNAGRSQIAAALFNKYADPSKARAISAGTQPAAHVHPEVIDAMRQRGIDVSTATPQKLTPELASTANWLITMGCGDQCPIVPGARRDDWPIIDPKGQSRQMVDRIIDDIDQRVRVLAASLDSARDQRQHQQ